jgi:hypothetical protein
MRSVRPVRTRLSGALAVLALATALGACGSDDPGSAAEQDPGATSSSPTEATESAATDEPSQIDEGGQIDPTVFGARLQSGIEKTEQAHIEFTMTGAGGEMSGAGDLDYTNETPEMQMTMTVGPETVGMLLIKKTMYIQSSQAGDKYLAYDLSDPDNPLGAGLSDQLDPAASMKTFVTALASVTSSGSEDVDGTPLDRYELTIDTAKLADQAQAAQLPPQMKITVWLDDQDRMAKTSMDMGQLVYVATLSDFDEPVELEAPPANQVAEPPPGV